MWSFANKAMANELRTFSEEAPTEAHWRKANFPFPFEFAPPRAIAFTATMTLSNICLSVVCDIFPAQLLRGYQSCLYGASDRHHEHVRFSPWWLYGVSATEVLMFHGAGYQSYRLPTRTQMQDGNKGSRYKGPRAFAMSTILESQLTWCGHWTPNR